MESPGSHPSHPLTIPFHSLPCLRLLPSLSSAPPRLAACQALYGARPRERLRPRECRASQVRAEVGGSVARSAGKRANLELLTTRGSSAELATIAAARSAHGGSGEAASVELGPRELGTPGLRTLRGVRAYLRSERGGSASVGSPLEVCSPALRRPGVASAQVATPPAALRKPGVISAQVATPLSGSRRRHCRPAEARCRQCPGGPSRGRQVASRPSRGRHAVARPSQGRQAVSQVSRGARVPAAALRTPARRRRGAAVPTLALRHVPLCCQRAQ